MAIKGTDSKQKITKELLEYFGERAFLYNDGKEIRVNCMEAGELVQIKIALTAAKVAVECGMDNAMPGAIATNTPENIKIQDTNVQNQSVGSPVQPTEEEKTNIKNLLTKLGL